MGSVFPQMLQRRYKGNTIILHIEEKENQKVCPLCGYTHLFKNGYRIRDFIGLPIGGKKTIIRMKVQRYKCMNESCTYDQQELNDIQLAFFKPQGAEELYDLSNDPFETRNLAALPEYKDKLKELRGILDENMIKQCDLGLLPECVWLEEGRENPYGYGRKSRQRIKKIKAVADMELGNFKSVCPTLKKSLNSDDPVERWWALTVCASFGK